jgi:predicted alpha-1,6-mannanase (GH76 family)
MLKRLVRSTLAALLLPSCLHAQDFRQSARSGVQTLQQWYNPDTGLYRTTGWWNSANAITILADSSKLGLKRSVKPILAQTFKLAPHQAANFLNNYYDDEGWWALAWIDAYDITHHVQYLHMAQTIFTNMAGGWDDTCFGGIWWSKDRTYKNAIANELFLSVAAHLANRVPADQQQQYITWAQREWTWFQHTGMINADNLINDGLDKTCHNNHKTTWTYNQGVILGGFTELSRRAPDPALLQQANQIASAAITHLADSNGILHDSCEPQCGGDGVQFKGIFMRNLSALDHAAPNPAYATFIRNNARSILTTNEGDGTKFGLVWSGPYTPADAATQTSALDAIIAAAALPAR